jgi:hypothetical protein
MEKWKDITQYSTAVTAFLSGVVLAFIQYFETGDLTSGVLGYVAQVLVYAAGIFGVTMYWNGKYREAMNVIDTRYNRIEKAINDRNNTDVVSGPSK